MHQWALICWKGEILNDLKMIVLVKKQKYFCLAVTNCKHEGMYLFYEVGKRTGNLTNQRPENSLIWSLYQNLRTYSQSRENDFNLANTTEKIEFA